MKLKTTVHTYYNKYSWEDKGVYHVYSHKFEDTEYQTHIGEQEIEIDVPDNYDPTAAQIAALEAMKSKAMADFHETVMKINDKISKLQAIEYTE